MKVNYFIFFFLLMSCELFDYSKVLLSRDPEENYNVFWNELNDYYGLIDFKTNRHLNDKYGGWQGLYYDHKKYIKPSMSDRELFSVLSSVLYNLKDSHSYWLYQRSPDFYYEMPTLNDYPHPPGISWASNEGDRKPKDSFGHDAFYSDLRIPEGYLVNDGFYGEGLMYAGIIDFDKIEDKSPIDIEYLDTTKKYGYVYILSFIKYNDLKNFNAAQNWSKDIDRVLMDLGNVDGLIIDIRHNSGGYEGNLERILKRFITREKKIYRSFIRSGSGKNNYVSEDYYTSPVSNYFKKQIVLLTDRATSSCGDLFTLSLKGEDNVIVVGQNTHGVLSKVITRELPIGWAFRMSSGYTLSPSGINYEEVGVSPDLLISKDTVERLYNDFNKPYINYYYYDPIFCNAVYVLDSIITGRKTFSDILDNS